MGEPALRLGVPVDVLGVLAQPVPEDQMPHGLRRSGREYVDVDVRIRALEQPVLVPVRLADGQPIAGRGQRRHVRLLVGRVRHGEVDVDDRLGGQTRHRGRPDVLDRDHSFAEQFANPARLAAVELRPRRVVGNDDHPRRRWRAIDPGGLHLFRGAFDALGECRVGRHSASSSSVGSRTDYRERRCVRDRDSVRAGRTAMITGVAGWIPDRADGGPRRPNDGGRTTAASDDIDSAE
jgi:hypothetical protein